MRVAFVGMGRNSQTIPRGYLYNFVRYHLELPYYYSRHPEIDVTLTFQDDLEGRDDEIDFDGYLDREDCVGKLELCNELALDATFDVVIHWRKWHDHLYRPGATNVLLSQDHSYGRDWMRDVKKATREGKLAAILVFPTWHERNTSWELTQSLGNEIPTLLRGLTLGVDTDIFYPGEADPFNLLWASDPGRGLDSLIPVFMQLYNMDRRFKLHVTWPDYVKDTSRWEQFLSSPGVVRVGQIPNDEKLWKLFRSCGVLPYASSFKEPSSRCHRQAMACGALVLYPPDMGSPSELLANGDGIVSDPKTWARTIYDAVVGGSWETYGAAAAKTAHDERWAVQTKRFFGMFSEYGVRQ